MKTLLLTALLCLVGFQAVAHSWYDYDCCSDRDCQAISADRVTITDEGYRVTLEDGDHLMVSGTFSGMILHGDEDIRPSQDGQYHACVSAPAMGSGIQMLLCLYAPLGV